MAFSPDGHRLATASSDKTARIWDVHSGGQLHALSHGPGKPVCGVVFSPDGRWLATRSGDETALIFSHIKARVWDAASGQQRHTLRHDQSVKAVAFSPDSRWLATATGSNRAMLWTLTPPSLQ